MTPRRPYVISLAVRTGYGDVWAAWGAPPVLSSERLIAARGCRSAPLGSTRLASLLSMRLDRSSCQRRNSLRRPASCSSCSGFGSTGSLSTPSGCRSRCQGRPIWLAYADDLNPRRVLADSRSTSPHATSGASLSLAALPNALRTHRTTGGLPDGPVSTERILPV
jgi:hypothetical protein